MNTNKKQEVEVPRGKRRGPERPLEDYIAGALRTFPGVSADEIRAGMRTKTAPQREIGLAVVLLASRGGWSAVALGRALGCSEATMNKAVRTAAETDCAAKRRVRELSGLNQGETSK